MHQRPRNLRCGRKNYSSQFCTGLSLQSASTYRLLCLFLTLAHLQDEENESSGSVMPLVFHVVWPEISCMEM